MKNEKFNGLYQRYFSDTPELKETLSLLGINNKQYQHFVSEILKKKMKRITQEKFGKTTVCKRT